MPAAARQPIEQAPEVAPSRGIWVIYKEGNGFIARKFFVAALFVFDANEELSAVTLEELRERLPAGLLNVGRDAKEPASVVETWA